MNKIEELNKVTDPEDQNESALLLPSDLRSEVQRGFQAAHETFRIFDDVYWKLHQPENKDLADQNSGIISRFGKARNDLDGVMKNWHKQFAKELKGNITLQSK